MTWEYGGCEWSGSLDSDGVFTDVKLVRVADIKALELFLIEDAEQFGYIENERLDKVDADEYDDIKRKQA